MMTIGTDCPMRRRLFCSPSTSLLGVSPITQISSPGRKPACCAPLSASTVLTTITPLRRVKVKSIRSNDDRLRWNDANAPATSATVSAMITRFVRIDLRMAATPVAFNGSAAAKFGLTS